MYSAVRRRDFRRIVSKLRKFPDDSRRLEWIFPFKTISEKNNSYFEKNAIEQIFNLINTPSRVRRSRSALVVPNGAVALFSCRCKRGLQEWEVQGRERRRRLLRPLFEMIVKYHTRFAWMTIAPQLVNCLSIRRWTYIHHFIIVLICCRQFTW